MFRKFFSVLLVLMLVNVHGCFPAYAEEVYTLKPGKVYRFGLDLYTSLDIDFSDSVLYYLGSSGNYTELWRYKNYGNSYQEDFNVEQYLFVYNVSDSSVKLTLNDGEVIGVNEYQSPFVMVMFDGSETALEVKNNSEEWQDYKVFHYVGNGSYIFYDETSIIEPGYTEQFEGIGVLLFEAFGGNFEDIFTVSGVYEVGDYIREGFFSVPPWILKTDLTGIIQALLDQLSTLLPVGLVILSVYLLISLAKYIVRLFL